MKIERIMQVHSAETMNFFKPKPCSRCQKNTLYIKQGKQIQNMQVRFAVVRHKTRTGKGNKLLYSQKDEPRIKKMREPGC